MVRKVLYPAVFVLVVLMASSALATGGGWKFNSISTYNYTMYPPPYDEVDGRIYEADGTTLVKEGSLVQIIIALGEGTAFVDPLKYYDYNDNGVVDPGTEHNDLGLWIRAGADPATISGGTNVLAYGTFGFTGEFATVGGSVDWAAEPNQEPTIANGVAQDKLAWRAWNLCELQMEKWSDLENFPEMFGVELWYTDGRELGTHDNVGGGPDTGWWIGMPAVTPYGGDLSMWAGFGSNIGAEIFDHYIYGTPDRRDRNQMDHYLGICVPEPSTMLLIGGAILLLLIRRKK